MKHYVFFLLAAALVNLGAGCLPGGDTAVDRASEPPRQAAPPVSEKTPATPREDEPDTGNDDPDKTESGIELPPIDDTWNAYENEAASFSFLWPTRGRYAPEWEVTFVSRNDARVSDGCFTSNLQSRGDQRSIQSAGVTLCHTRYAEGAAGSVYYTDYFLGEINGSLVLFTFTKRLANGDNFEDESCHGQTVLAVDDTCVPFEDDAYRAHLDQIMGTLQVE